MQNLTRRLFLSNTAAAGALGGGIATLADADAMTSDDDMSWEEFAALDFEPWERDLLTNLPSNEEWQNRIVTIRLAAVMLTKTKPELIEALSGMETAPTAEGDESLAVHLMEGLDGTRDLLRGVLAIMDQAFARCACAAMST